MTEKVLTVVILPARYVCSGNGIMTVLRRDAEPCPTTGGKNLLRVSLKIDFSLQLLSASRLLSLAER